MPIGVDYKPSTKECRFEECPYGLVEFVGPAHTMSGRAPGDLFLMSYGIDSPHRIAVLLSDPKQTWNIAGSGAMFRPLPAGIKVTLTVE
ncbi:MAG: hypothetical protein E6Q97_12105 [Desulfurellales bacterium]|nr:MAG: hypothetical protein E6Q97_12105 [Desulfurellales bacterium]